MVPSLGLEPRTLCLEDRCSVQLSYEGNLFKSISLFLYFTAFKITLIISASSICEIKELRSLGKQCPLNPLLPSGPGTFVWLLPILSSEATQALTILKSIFFSEYNYMTNHFLAWLMIPFALFTVKNTSSRLDRFFGDCSYPLYLIHWTTATICGNFFLDLIFEKRLIYTASLVILSYLLSGILTLTIDKYFNNLRNKIHHKIN